MYPGVNPMHPTPGGRFHLGATTLRLAQGDLYIYPASYPHAVESITAGRYVHGSAWHMHWCIHGGRMVHLACVLLYAPTA